MKKLFFTFICMAFIALGSMAKTDASAGKNAPYIVIDKETMTLTLFNADGTTKAKFPMACGLNYGDKQKKGDKRTPEGEFTVQQIQNASSWTHDFGDGKGEIKGAYGPWFIRLLTPPHTGIGIHGTHNPKSIGTRCTEGCIRLNNAHVDSLKKMVKVGTKVTILPSEKDKAAMGAPSAKQAPKAKAGATAPKKRASSKAKKSK